AVGAGDTFIAGMLYGLICHPGDWSTGRKLGFAVQLATLKVQREGFDGLGADMLELETAGDCGLEAVERLITGSPN
ncbi:hypothetical protein ACHAPA_005656, partial [Fusarium lateritium]